ncbi:DUF4296 domain-containing protein [Elizabethkingia argentiflava]|uniref:DUF4296 domain-containing protein n=1 Tax=Elizabethkingia argenteiflava TaxID=2681556 RepID=A0A845PXK6_9FLAO|nr:DUF4296 domain-containing protein [Elizabethkingia argenteiflava]NAW51671.1 DUF4296 domain-containing protein [Elizabethkingia argenteiflava]
MKPVIVYLCLICLLACSNVEEPKNLISKEEMSSIFVDMAIYEGTFNINPQADIKGVSKYILQEHKISGERFLTSYNYYLIQKELPAIFDKAEEKLMQKDPKLKAYIEKKNKETKVSK